MAIVCEDFYETQQELACYYPDPEHATTNDLICESTSVQVLSYSICYEDGTTEGPTPNEEPCSLPENFEACYFVTDPPEPLPPGCAGKSKIIAQNSNLTITSQNHQLKSNLNSTNAQTKLTEYGFNQRLNSWNSSTRSFLTTPIITGSVQQNNVAGINGVFSWDATNGYTVGFTHSHPNDSPQSPADIFSMMANSQQLDLTNAGASAVAFYKANASVTVVEANGDILVATVNDWSAFATLYSQYQSDPAAFNLAVHNDAISTGSSTEAALLRAFGSSINLYTNNGTQSYTPIVLDSSSSIGASLGQCPN